MFLSIVVSCLTLYDFSTAGINVTVSKKIYNIQAGDDVTLQCSINSDEGLDYVHWKKDKNNIFDSGIYNKYSGSTLTDPSLTIHDTNESDSGVYQCNGRRGSVFNSSQVSLHVTRDTFTVSIYPDSANITALEGSDVTPRSCASDDCPAAYCEIEWTVPSGERKKSNIFTKPITIDQAGEYKCIARAGNVSQSKSIYVTVKYAASALRLIPNDTLYSHEEGTTIPDIQCVAECNPTCEMSWHHDRSGPIFEGRNLSLRNIERSKDGNYMCKAANSLGTRNINLTVLSLCK
ncbi:neuronal growth regulator 1-like [Pecten maximus]|uniref:neuronal growth regulator 1-like n=1 Tax=Pecten maximus TaxID=6579 RepID=UPI001457E954|nr:neuronal growth regulator 1-like [Pecten maximus]